MAERYSKKRYLSQFGQTKAPRLADLSSLSRASALRQESLTANISAIQKILVQKLEKGAAKRAAQNAVNNDPYVLLQQTEGSFNLEDELTNKHAITKIGNNLMDSIVIDIGKAEQESFANDDSSAIFNNKITNIIKDNIKGLRDSGVDAPILELEIQESIAGSVRSMINAYASKRVNLKNRQLKDEITTKGINLTATAARTNDPLDIENLNNWKIEHQAFLNKNPGIAEQLESSFKFGKMKAIQLKVGYLLENNARQQDLITMLAETRKVRDSLGVAPDDRILSIHDSIVASIKNRLGSKASAVDIYENRGKLGKREYKVLEGKYSGEAIYAVQMIDQGVFTGQITEDTDPEFLYNLYGTIADTPVEIQTLSRQFIKEATLNSLKEYAQDPGGFVARRMDLPVQAIFDKKTDIETLKTRFDNNHVLVTAADAKQIETLFKGDVKLYLESWNAIIKPIEESGLLNAFYQDLISQVDADTKTKISALYAATDAGYLTEYQQGLVIVESNTKNADSLTENIKNGIKTRDQNIVTMLTEKLGYTKTTKLENYNAYFDLIQAIHTKKPTADDDQLEEIIDQVLGLKEENGEIVNGYVSVQRYGIPHVYLNQETSAYPTDAGAIEDGLQGLNTKSMYLFKRKYNYDTGEFELDSSTISANTLPIEVVGTVFGTPVELTADKLTQNYIFRNLDISDLVPDSLKNQIQINISGSLVVAVGQDFKIIKNADGTPAIWDLSEIGWYQRNVLDDVGPYVDTLTPQISDVKITSRYITGRDVEVPGPITRDVLDDTYRETRTDVEKIEFFRKNL